MLWLVLWGEVRRGKLLRGKKEETAFLGDFVLDLTLPERIGEALSGVRLGSFLALGFFTVISILVGRIW